MNTRNSPETIAEARRRNSSLSDEQWQTWLAYVAAHGGRIVLTVDGAACYAEYPREPATPADSQ